MLQMKEPFGRKKAIQLPHFERLGNIIRMPRNTEFESEQRPGWKWEYKPAKWAKISSPNRCTGDVPPKSHSCSAPRGWHPVLQQATSEAWALSSDLAVLVLQQSLTRTLQAQKGCSKTDHRVLGVLLMEVLKLANCLQTEAKWLINSFKKGHIAQGLTAKQHVQPNFLKVQIFWCVNKIILI